MPPEAVAQINGRSITVAALTNAMARHRDKEPPEQTRAALDELICSQALLAKAQAAGYDHQQELIEQFERLIVARFREDQLEPRLSQAAQAREDEIQARYSKRAMDFTSPEAVRAGILFLRSSAKAEPEIRRQLRSEAEVLLEAARQTNAAGFARLVQSRSDDQATRYAGGDSGWLTREGGNTRWPTEAVAAAFGLTEPGQCAPLVDAPQGFYIVRLVERRPARTRPLAEVRETIRHQLIQEKRRQAEAEFYTELKAGLQITVNHALLEELLRPATTNAQRPPPLPGG